MGWLSKHTSIGTGSYFILRVIFVLFLLQDYVQRHLFDFLSWLKVEMRFKNSFTYWWVVGASCVGLGACVGRTNVIESADCISAEILDFLRNRKITVALIIDRLSPPEVLTCR